MATIVVHMLHLSVYALSWSLFADISHMNKVMAIVLSWVVFLVVFGAIVGCIFLQNDPDLNSAALRADYRSGCVWASSSTVCFKIGVALIVVLLQNGTLKLASCQAALVCLQATQLLIVVFCRPFTSRSSGAAAFGLYLVQTVLAALNDSPSPPEYVMLGFLSFGLIGLYFAHAIGFIFPALKHFSEAPADSAPMGHPLTLVHAFEQQAARTPNNIAIEEELVKITYAEMMEKAAALARELHTRFSPAQGRIIAIYLPRGVQQYICQLGVMKAGAAYLPIDIEIPHDRIEYMLNDASVLGVITIEKLSWIGAHVNGKVILIDNPSTKASLEQARTQVILKARANAKLIDSEPSSDDLALPSCPSEDVKNQPNDPAYVIYTSGTTGRPKGCMLAHGNIIAYVYGMKGVYGFNASDRILQGFSVSSDASLGEIWAAFAAGATLVVASKEDMMAVDELASLLRKKEITAFSTVPTVLSMALHDNGAGEIPKLRLVYVGGEALRPDVLQKWWRPWRRVLNEYGPTECSVVATYWEGKPGETVHIGDPVPGYVVQVMDENELRQLPDGQEGELVIGGPGVSNFGYINRPEVNAQKFFLDNNKQRWYRSGDLVKVDAQKRLLFLGRIDDQVKIRGYRVELGEIESEVSQALGADVVVTWEMWLSPGQPTLNAYVISNDPQGSDLEILKTKLKEQLPTLRQRMPTYMIPSHYALLLVSEIVRNTGGKVDKKKLPPILNLPTLTTPTAPAQDENASSEIGSTGNEALDSMKEVWQSVLQRGVGVDEDFVDLGGNSMSAAEIVTTCEKQGVSVSIRDIYALRTIRALVDAKCVPHDSETVPKLAEIFSSVLKQEIGIQAKFVDIGGNSMMAAEIVNECQQAGLPPLSIREIFSLQTISAIAQVLDGRGAGKSGVTVERPWPHRVSDATYYTVCMLQLITLTIFALFGGAMLAAEFYCLDKMFSYLDDGGHGVIVKLELVVLGISVLTQIFIEPLTLVLCACLKGFVVGSLPEGDYPIWSFTYYRWWVGRLAQQCIIEVCGVFEGTMFLTTLYKWMGLTVGEDVNCQSSAIFDYNLIEIGDGSFLSQSVILRTMCMQDGLMKFRKIKIGRNCYFGSQVIIGGGAVIGNNVRVLPMTRIPMGATLPDNTTWQGTPMQQVHAPTKYTKILDQQEQLCIDRPLPWWTNTFWDWFQPLALIFVENLYDAIELLPEIAVIGSFDFIEKAFFTLDLKVLIPLAFVMAPIATLERLIVTIIFKWLFCGKIKEGMCRRNSWMFLRYQICQLMMSHFSSDNLRPLVETPLTPWIYRALGAKIGKNCELSTMAKVTPDLLTVGNQAMLADDVTLGDVVQWKDAVYIPRTTIGDEVFIGNGSEVTLNTDLVPNKSLVGLYTIVPDKMNEDSIAFGSPAMVIPGASEAHDKSSHQSYVPPWYMVAFRLIGNLFKVTVPNGIIECCGLIALSLVTYFGLLNSDNKHFLNGDMNYLYFTLAAPLGLIVWVLILSFSPLLLKWPLIWKFENRDVPLWHPWMWATDVIYELDIHIVEHLQDFFMCTPIITNYHRIMGAKIGRRCVLGYGSFFSEWDLCTVGDDCTIEGSLQCHSFEARMYKMRPVTIGNHCWLGFDANMQPGSTLEDGAAVDDLSVLMKGSVAQRGKVMHGVPAEPMC